MSAPTAAVRCLLDAASIDAYGPDEEFTGLWTMIEDNLETPFETSVLGVTVIVERVLANERDEIVAVCRSGPHRQAISLADLPIPTPPPEGHEWIEAYRWWTNNRM